MANFVKKIRRDRGMSRERLSKKGGRAPTGTEIIPAQNNGNLAVNPALNFSE